MKPFLIIAGIALIAYLVYKHIFRKSEINEKLAETIARLNTESLEKFPIDETIKNSREDYDGFEEGYRALKPTITLYELIECKNELLDRQQFKNQKSCQDCGLDSGNLLWIDYSSSPRSWKNLAGTAGNLSICPNCNTQVQFIMTMMS